MTELEKTKADLNALIEKCAEHTRGMANDLDSITNEEKELYMKVIKSEIQKDDSIENHFKARILANKAVLESRKNK